MSHQSPPLLQLQAKFSGEGVEIVENLGIVVDEIPSTDAEIAEAKNVLKGELRDSKCCRFCGLGTKGEDKLLLTAEFIAIFEKQSLAIDENDTLDLVINRYLPIKVLKSDPFYPRVICTDCYDCLKSTITFFDKICEGQKLLAKILNQYPTAAAVEAKVIEAKLELQFSEGNPVIKAPKRRGRPRKDPNKQVAVDISSTNDSEIAETQTRAKRQSRPPVRYMDQNVNDLFKAECLDEGAKVAETGNAGQYDILGNYVTRTRSNGESTTGLISSLDADFSNNENLVDMEKLSAIMDGDEDVETSSAGRVRILNKNAAGAGSSSSTQLSVAQQNNHQQLTDEHDLKRTRGAATNKQLESEYSDGDESVKLSDLIGRKKKPVKRKRKYKKRVLNPGSKIQCPQCPKTFNHRSSLVYHRLSAHETTKKFICETCGRAFTHRSLLTNHMHVHSSEKSFACHSCPAKFKSRASLYTHKKSIHSAVREFTCDKCGFQFNLKSSLIQHMRIHTKEKPFICEFCTHAFASRSSLREHRRTHTGERPYVCFEPECNKSFTTASQLRSHKFSHSDQKNHLCQICGKGFSHAENFKYHMRRHTGERPLQCLVCKKQFIEPWSLKKHARIHTGEMPYNCDQCERKFKDPSNFSKHKKLHLNSGMDTETEFTQSSVEYTTEIKTEKEVAIVRSSNALVNKNLSIDMNELQDQVSQTSSDRTVDTDAPSTVQILSSDGLTYEAVVNDGDQQVEQVIYVYSGDSPLFALSMSNSQQPSELRPEGESSVEGYQGIDSLGMPFATESTGEFESHYYSLETVDGTTVAVPITITPGTTFDVSNSRGMLSAPLGIEADEFKPESETV